MCGNDRRCEPVAKSRTPRPALGRDHLEDVGCFAHVQINVAQGHDIEEPAVRGLTFDYSTHEVAPRAEGLRSQRQPRLDIKQVVQSIEVEGLDKAAPFRSHGVEVAPLGRLDIDFTSSVAYATLCVAESLTEEDVRELISEIDERLVLTTDPFREDLIVTVWAGRESGVYSDEDFEGEEDEDEDEGDIEGNGHRRR